MRVLSYSGGVQSTAILVMAAQGLYPIDAAIHIDLGLAESPDTLQYVASVALPYAVEAGIDVRVEHVGAISDLLHNPAHPKPPFRARGSGGLMVRQCTNHWKIRPFRRALRRLLREKGQSLRRNAVEVVLGISFDEIDRVKPPDVQYYSHVYPLIDAKFTRDDCVRIISNAGLPVPDKSACWFCPFTPSDRVRNICARHTDIAVLASHLDAVISVARRKRGLPALEIVPSQTEFLSSSECTGYCMT